jgi:hypothetical protein
MVKYLKPASFLFFLFIVSANNLVAQKNKIRNNYASQKSIPHLAIERSMIYEPQKEWMYSHHSSIAFFKGTFIATWSNGIKDEDSPGQRVLFSRSKDFFHWSRPTVLANPSVYKSDTLNILTAAGLYQHKDTLVAYYGEYSPIRTNTHLWAKYSVDGIHWSEAIDMHVPVNPNHGPTAIANGRLIICGNFTFPYTDDPSGLRGWKMSSFYDDSLYKEDNPETFEAPAIKMHLPPLCEGSFFQTDDHILHMLLRATDDGWKGKLWLTESKDNGINWSLPVETNFTDNDSKFHFGRLPDKRFYYVGIPDTTHRSERIPLVFAISTDGAFFDKQYIIAHQIYTQKQEGLWKDGQYGYPHTIVHNGYMYVIISRLKESVEVIRFKLKGL